MASRQKTGEGFVYEQDGVVYLKLCVDVTLYFVGSLSDHAPGILDFYQQALTIIKPEIVQYETGTMSRPKRVKADTFDMLPLWLSDSKAKRDMMQLRLDNSTGPDSAADQAFQFVYFEYDKAGALRLVLPASFVEKGAKPLADLARTLARKLKFSSGLGGYSLNWNHNGDFDSDATGDIAVISQRYRGIDIPDVGSDVGVISQGIKCVNWLTFLGHEYVDRLGGIERLKKALGKEIMCDPVSDGIIIQAGPQPETGDVNRRQTLPLYHSVGKSVAKVRIQQHNAFIPGKDADQATAKWLARFDS